MRKAALCSHISPKLSVRQIVTPLGNLQTEALLIAMKEKVICEMAIFKKYIDKIKHYLGLEGVDKQ